MKIKKEFTIGFVATITIVGAYLGFNFLKGKDIFNKNNKYYVLYDKIAGLSESNSVYLNGFKIGSVGTIKLYPNDSLHRVLVEMNINKDIKIPSKSTAKIQSDFLGVNTISIIYSKSKKYAKDGDTLLPAIATTIQEEVSMQIMPLKVKTEKMLASLDTVLESVKYVFNKETQRVLANTFLRIQTTIENIEHSSFTLDTVLTTQKASIKRILGNITEITENLKNNKEQISHAIENFSAISDSLAQIDFKSTMDKTDKVLSDFQTISDKINNGEGSLGLLVNNDTLYYELESASHELHKLLEDMKLNPQRYVNFSIFGRNPKRNVYVDPDSLNKKK